MKCHSAIVVGVSIPGKRLPRVITASATTPTSASPTRLIEGASRTRSTNTRCNAPWDRICLYEIPSFSANSLRHSENGFLLGSFLIKSSVKRKISSSSSERSSATPDG